ncbi:NR2E3 protein, partial [Acromyrmex insinuator]
MNGAATVTATEDHQHQQTQNETTSEHPRSPASPLSARHDSGESSVISPGLPERYSPLGATGSTSSHDPYSQEIERYLVLRRCNTKGPPTEPVSWHGAVTSAGGSPCKLICVHTPVDPQGTRLVPSCEDPSPVFILQKHIIHLFTHLSVLRAAGIVRLIELPEACAIGYHARRSSCFMLSDARRGCAGCALFIANIVSKATDSCQAGTGRCVVDKAHRNQCQACRLKKCMQMGMNKDDVCDFRNKNRSVAATRSDSIEKISLCDIEFGNKKVINGTTLKAETRMQEGKNKRKDDETAVQNERQPRNTATIRPEALVEMDQERALREAAVAVGVFGPPVSLAMARYTTPLPLPTVAPTTNSANNATTPPRQENEDGNASEDSIDVTNEEPLTPQRSGCTQLPPVLPSLYSPASAETVYETSARLLFMAVKWAKNLPSFAGLPFRDQVILLEEVWSELFLLNAVQWCLPLESSPLFSAAELTALTLSPHPHPHSGLHLQTTTGKPSQVAADVRHLHDTLQRYKAVMVDPAEFACMKAIVLFRPETRGLKDSSQIENLQDQAQLMLGHHARAQQPNSPARFGRLLLLLPLLRTVPAARVELIYFHRTIGNTPMEKVLCDMYKN